MNENHRTLITSIAAKLYTDGVTSENITPESVDKILDGCVAPRVCKAIYNTNQGDVLTIIKVFEADDKIK